VFEFKTVFPSAGDTFVLFGASPNPGILRLIHIQASNGSGRLLATRTFVFASRERGYVIAQMGLRIDEDEV